MSGWMINLNDAAKNFETLKKVLTNYTSSEANLKAGLKNNLQSVSIKAAKIFRVEALTESKRKSQ